MRTDFPREVDKCLVTALCNCAVAQVRVQAYLFPHEK